MYGQAADSIYKSEEIAIAGKENILYSGFSAQQVESAAKKIGYNFSGIQIPQNDKDHYSLAYAEFVVPLVKAIQEQQLQIEAANEKNKIMLGLIEKMQQQIDALTQKIK